jgi:hypothetical protein
MDSACFERDLGICSVSVFSLYAYIQLQLTSPFSTRDKTGKRGLVVIAGMLLWWGFTVSITSPSKFKCADPRNSLHVVCPSTRIAQNSATAFSLWPLRSAQYGV